MNNHTLHEYQGNVHIHSSYSDGTGSVFDIAESALRVGLDFIIINDHDYMTASLHLEDEGYYRGLLVLMGLEIGFRYHHYLAFGLKNMLKGSTLKPQEVIDLVNSQGGIGFLAHPFEKGMHFLEKSMAYTWNDLTVTDYTGICIWNFSSRWKERVKTLVHGIVFLLFKSQTLKGPSRKTLSFWDSSCLKRRVVGIGGSDAHGWILKKGRFSFTPISYEFALSSINIHIMLRNELPRGDLDKAKGLVYGALKQASLFICNDRLAPGKGFRFYYVSDKKHRLEMGEEACFQNGKLFVQSPRDCEIRFLRNGKVQDVRRGKIATYRVDKAGVYRVEAYKRLPLFGLHPWIFSNPIYLR